MTNNPLANISVLQLKRAVAIREQIQTLQNELDRIAGGQSASGKNSAAPEKKKVKMSDEDRAKLSATMTAKWAKIKAAASEAILASGGTITHHHAVGRLHRPWWEQERSPLFEVALSAAKDKLDPSGILNPGCLLPSKA